MGFSFERGCGGETILPHEDSASPAAFRIRLDVANNPESISSFQAG